MKLRTHRIIGCALLTQLIATGCESARATQPAASIDEFRQHLEKLRHDGHIHSMSAIIIKDQGIVWSSSFSGDATRPVSDTTVFHLASLTKPMASTVILQLVDEGKVSLDDPVSKYGISLPNAGTVLVKHLLSHTSGGTPGTSYAYDGNRFSLLDSVISRASGKPVAAAIHERIVVPLGLRHTAPSPQSAAFTAIGLNAARYLANVAPGYRWTGSQYAITAYETHFSSAAGMTASTRDYAGFSMAMDRDALINSATKALAWTAGVGPYGLGWFVTDYKDLRVVWHYGYWTASSTLIVKVPAQGLTFILFANTDGLSARYPLGAGKLEASPWAREFLETFAIAKVPVQ
jgi:CubicO group peptidase (beta-lactamase class C family)